MIKKEYRDRDNSIGSLCDDLAASFKRLAKRVAMRYNDVVLYRHDRGEHNYYLTLHCCGLVARVNLNDSSPQLRLINLDTDTLRERYYGSDRLINRQVRCVEEDLKDYAIAVNKLTTSEKNELFKKL